MDESAFDATAYSVAALSVLALSNNVGLHPDNVILWDQDTLVVLFTDGELAERYAAGFSNRGRLVEAYGFPSADELTDTLACLRDRGATHVAFNTCRAEAPRYPISPVIIGFQLRG